MNGNTGKILRINLTTRKQTIEEPDELFYRTYGGGRGLIAYYLLKEVPCKADPLGPENVLVFAASPTTGLAVSGCARHSVGAKSPLTGGYGDGEAGGFWGTELKRAGWDGIVITGKSDGPVYISIKDDEVELITAKSTWGSEIYETIQTILKELGDNKTRIAAIGPAGEKLIRMAAIIYDCDRASARTGIGAVMGSKNLKAVAVRGTGIPEAADKEKIRELAKYAAGNMDQLAGWLKPYGTGQHLRELMEIGNLPVRNYKGGSFEGVDEISAERYEEQGLLSTMSGCYACTARCKKVLKEIKEPFKVNPAYGAPEYETVGAFGSNCGISDLLSICKAHEICNANGLDTISTGSLVSFAIECYEEGIITDKDTGGLELRWGNSESMLTLLKMIVSRTGFGDILAEGQSRAVQIIGRGSEAYAMAVKGQGIAMHESRLQYGLGLGYMVSPTGADHSHNVHDEFYAPGGWGVEGIRPLGLLEPIPSRKLGPEKVRLFTYVVMERHLRNILDICTFIAWPMNLLVDLINAATGWNTGSFELMKISERVINLMQIFNLREGLTAEDDRLPRRFFEPHPNGALSDKGLDPDEMKDALKTYYGMMGWDRTTGIPGIDKLYELNIGWAEKHLGEIR